MGNNIERTIVVPAYSEEKFIGRTLDHIYDYLKDLGWISSTEIICVTADAQDQTQKIVEEKIKIFPNHRHIQPGKKIGKGRDVRAGLSEARGKYVLFMDADLATPLNYVKTFFEILEECGGVVIGIRSIHNMHKTIIRRVTSVLSNILVRALISWSIPDSQCGFKAFDKSSLKIILPRSKINGWGFDFEFIKIAKLHKVNISQVFIPDWKDPKPEGQGLAGDSQFKAMKNTLLELFKVKTNQLKGVYR